MLDVFMRLMTEVHFIAANIRKQKKQKPYTYHSVAAFQRDRAWNQYCARLNFSVFGGYIDVIMYCSFVCVLFPVKSSLHLTTLEGGRISISATESRWCQKVRLKSPFTLVCLIFRHEMRWRWAYHEDDEQMNSGEWLCLGTFTPEHLTVMRPPHHHNPSTLPGTFCNQQKKTNKQHVYVFGLKVG